MKITIEITEKEINEYVDNWLTVSGEELHECVKHDAFHSIQELFPELEEENVIVVVND
ncbi:hypothetical protein J8V57_09735 [Xenorhabdus sp. PB61.4]|uniref:hypothetical protein n=1 Tax=Xenorhabdus sp. PB61.4 TaxID=2788940 RepID=UPI001E2AD6F4|nr:hypothetical protein [Xenorhabdus sp. PB61.4]MCC8366561.1 hypothetical protein [Xenorhabdus sp. PB61.4]